MPDPRKKKNRRDRLQRLKLGPFAQQYEEIEEEATRLLEHLDQLPGKRGRVKSGQPTRSLVSSKAIELLYRCNELEVPPPMSLISSISKIVQAAPSKPALAAKKLKAAKLDAKSKFEKSKRRSLGEMSNAISGDHKKERQNVRNWRNNAEYQAAVDEAELDLWSDKISRLIDDEDADSNESL